MSKPSGGRAGWWIALIALAAVLAGAGAWLFLHWPTRPRQVPGDTDLVLHVAADGTLTCNGKTFYDPRLRDFKRVEDLFESRRQEKYKPPPDFVDYTLFVDADPGVRWTHLYRVWDRAIRDGGVTKAVLRLPHEKEEARVVFARRKDPPPDGAREVLLAVRWEWVHVGPLPWPTGTLTDRSALGFRVETATERVGRFTESSPPDDLRLAARAADKVRAGIAEAGASGDPVRVVLLFHSDTPVRQVLALLSALDRAGVGEVEIAETRPR